MIPATQEQIEAACMTRSAAQAAQYLAALDIFASEWECKQDIKCMIECGDRPARLNAPGAAVAPVVDQASICRAYLRRLLEAEQHCISDPARMASALREAGMVPA